jgi:hypothetical protein
MDGLPGMELKAAPLWATWTVPSLTGAHLEHFSTGDRITSDVFSVDGLGDDASFVLYPQGDYSDAISKVGKFVNVGLFGSAQKDVTFRMTAGRASKVMTATTDRYQAKVVGHIKASGEWFDPCFATMEEMLDQDSDELKLHLEVLDTQAIHSLSAAPSGIVTWQLENIRHLRQQMDEGERLSSRYINEPPRVKGEKGNFLSLGIAFLGGGLEFAITRVERPPPGYSSNEDDVFSVSLTADDKDLETKEVRCSWTGVSDTKTVRFEIPKGKLPESISFKLARV